MTRRPARSLRHRPTDAEQRLWLALRARRLAGYKFRRQHPIGRFVADFVCPGRWLVIELDGGEHWRRAAHDRLRDGYLEERGYLVVRFSDRDVLTNMDGVLQAILLLLERDPMP